MFVSLAAEGQVPHGQDIPSWNVLVREMYGIKVSRAPCLETFPRECERTSESTSWKGRMRKRGTRSAYIVRFNINLISWISPSSYPLWQLALRERVTPPFLRARPASAQSASYYVIRINFTVPKYFVRKMRSSPSSFSCACTIGIQFVDAFCVPWRKPTPLQW